jgi:hypothetical protein
MISWSALSALMASVAVAGATELAMPLPVAPPTPPAASGMDPGRQERRGSRLVIDGQSQQAGWRLTSNGAGPPTSLWLPLEVLQNQLGVSSRTRSDGQIDLEWYGLQLSVPAAAQRSLGDEVAIDVAPLLTGSGARIEPAGDTLSLGWPRARLQGIRGTDAGGRRRLVLDLDRPAPVRQGEGSLVVSLAAAPGQVRELAAWGLAAGTDDQGLRIPTGGAGAPRRWLTLGNPTRLVIDLPAAAGGTATAETPLDPRLESLLGGAVVWQRQERTSGRGRVRINAVGIDPAAAPLQLRPLDPGMGMEGLTTLTQLARRHDALVAINGGYFNRVRRLPLGALRLDGRWLSGPILNRGAVGWDGRQLPRFGRLHLQEWLMDGTGRRWPLQVVNSGYVQRGLSRYTRDWGPMYRPLSGSESAVRLRQGTVVEVLDTLRLEAGVPLGPEDQLVVGRGGIVPPWPAGARLELSSGSQDPVGQASQVVGGGPLLLLQGRIVLNGTLEGFSPAFLAQGAPRTVIASDGQRLWLITLEGVGHGGPTLAEAAWLLQELGMRDALNLDGGSSTGLVMGGRQTVLGRGVVGSVHHGLGLVPVP